MIERVLTLCRGGIQYVRQEPQLLLTLALILVIPVAFLYTAASFKELGRANQERLENDRIGIIHDVFGSFARAAGDDVDLIQTEIDRLSEQNPDITIFRFTKRIDEAFIPIAAIDRAAIGTPDEEDIYRLAYADKNDSLVVPFYKNGERYIQGVKRIQLNSEDYFILTEISRVQADRLFASRERDANIILALVLLVVMVLVLRHVFIVNYGYLYREAKKAIETKDMFMNMIAHELRAPLTAIRGYASMMREDRKLDVKVQEEARRIEDSSERLITIVNDLLDVARIQSGKLSVTKESVNLSEVIRSALETLASSADKKHLELRSEGTHDPVMITGDSKRLTQAFTNLISNAIKYTEKGGIEVAVTTKRDRVEVRVKDSGMGIDAASQKELFAPFFRVKDSASNVTGTGLGMWITKQLIELMGGSVGVESIKGIGTHVVVTLPNK